MQQKWSQLTKIAPLKNLLGNMEVLILVTNEQNCWKTESGKHFGLTPLWGSVPISPSLSRHTQLHWTSPALHAAHFPTASAAPHPFIAKVTNHILCLIQHPFIHIPIIESESIFHINLHCHNAYNVLGHSADVAAASGCSCCDSFIWRLDYVYLSQKPRFAHTFLILTR